MADAISDGKMLTMEAQITRSQTIVARCPPLPQHVSLGPSDIMMACAMPVCTFSLFWPASPRYDEHMLLISLSAVLEGYPSFVGRLQPGGKVRLHLNAFAIWPILNAMWVEKQGPVFFLWNLTRVMLSLHTVSVVYRRLAKEHIQVAAAPVSPVNLPIAEYQTNSIPKVNWNLCWYAVHFFFTSCKMFMCH